MVRMGGAGRSGDGLQMVSKEGLSIREQYRWEGLGGLELGYKWLIAGLVWEGLGCVGFVYKIVEIAAASSNNGSG